jgi:hypothetical protein
MMQQVGLPGSVQLFLSAAAKTAAGCQLVCAVSTSAAAANKQLPLI